MKQARYLSILLLSLLFASVTGSTARAQAARSGTHVSLSVTVGPTYNWLSDVAVENVEDLQHLDPERRETLQNGRNIDYPMRMGFNAGLFLGVARGVFGVRAGAVFLNPGALFDGTTFLNQDELDVNFVTFRVDAQARKTLGRMTAYVFGGPELRYMLDLSDREDVSFSTFRENLDPLSATASIGAGLRLNLMGYRVGPEIRYAIDLTGIGGETFRLGDETFQLTNPYKLNHLHLGLVFGM